MLISILNGIAYDFSIVALVEIEVKRWMLIEEITESCFSFVQNREGLFIFFLPKQFLGFI
jgi:hypothetical protein